MKYKHFEVKSTSGQKKDKVLSLSTSSSYSRNPNQIFNTIQSDKKKLLSTLNAPRHPQITRTVEDHTRQFRFLMENQHRGLPPKVSSKQTAEITSKHKTKEKSCAPKAISGKIDEDEELEENSLEHYHWLGST